MLWGDKSCYLRGQLTWKDCENTVEYTTFDATATEKAPLTFAIAQIGGYVNGVEADARGFWGKDDWPNSADVHDTVLDLEDVPVFKPLSLRTTLDTPKKSTYALLAYDPYYTGEAGIAVFNLGDKEDTINVDVPSSGSMSFNLDSREYQLEKLGNFGKYTNQGRINCYGSKHGASYSPDSSGTMDLASCFLACNNDKSCEAVTMKWVAAGDVECFKRGGLTLKDCEPTPPDADDIYSTYTKD